MNTLPDIRVKEFKFGCVPPDMNHMEVRFKTKAEAMRALETGKIEGGEVVSCNFDWQNRKDWGASMLLTWPKGAE